MTTEQQRRILDIHRALPDGCRSEPASGEAITAFEVEYGPIPDHYRWYLQACGGGVVGSEWVDDIHELRNSHRKFKGEEGDIDSCFIFGWDGGGNPLLIDRRSGEVFTHDHDFGGRHSIAPSFIEFYLNQNKEN